MQPSVVNLKRKRVTKSRENRRQLGNAALWQSWSKWNRPTTRPQIVLERSSPLTAGPNVGSRYNLFTHIRSAHLHNYSRFSVRCHGHVTLKVSVGRADDHVTGSTASPTGGTCVLILIKKWFFLKGQKCPLGGHETSTDKGTTRRRWPVCYSNTSVACLSVCTISLFRFLWNVVLFGQMWIRR